MNGLKVVKVAELRKKLASIPAKLILTIVIVCALFWNTDLGMTLSLMKEKPFDVGFKFLVIYGALSYLYFFVKLFHNYLIGILVAAAAAYALYSMRGNITKEQGPSLPASKAPIWNRGVPARPVSTAFWEGFTARVSLPRR